MIAVIDYGLGNLRSVSKALEAVGAEVEVTNNSEKIAAAKAIVLPGVGAFHRGVENLKSMGIVPSIFKAIGEGKPFLGICLGLQLLFAESEEHGRPKGLNVIKGRVKRFTPTPIGNKKDYNWCGGKVPHMGWNSIKSKMQNAKCKVKIFEGIPEESYFYFVHSYYVEPESENVIAATTDYGKEFVSAIVQDNVWGVQFHPEKSADLGLKILENFVRISSGY